MLIVVVLASIIVERLDHWRSIKIVLETSSRCLNNQHIWLMKMIVEKPLIALEIKSKIKVFFSQLLIGWLILNLLLLWFIIDTALHSDIDKSCAPLWIKAWLLPSPPTLPVSQSMSSINRRDLGRRWLRLSPLMREYLSSSGILLVSFQNMTLHLSRSWKSSQLMLMNLSRVPVR